MKKKAPFSDYPQIPDEIIDAIDNGKLLLFIGAGISKLYGYPLWNELARDLANVACYERIISFSEREVLLDKNYNPQKVISIIVKKFDDQNQKGKAGIDYLAGLLRNYNGRDSKLELRIAKYLSNYNAVIVTTNADESLEGTEYFKDRKVLYSMSDFNVNYKDYSFVHIHGSAKKPDSMVFTSEKYAEIYSFESEVGKKIKELLNGEWTILFIGYGISEFELLRYFIKKEKGPQRLFKIDGYFYKDKEKLELDKIYYESLGVKLLPFSREKDDFRGLIKLLKKWNSEIERRTFGPSLRREVIINEILNKKPVDENIHTINEMINIGEKKRLVVEELCHSIYLIEWLKCLKDNKTLFSPIINIKPCEETKNKNYRTVPWDALKIINEYCERKINDNSVDDFIKNLINESISVYKKDNETDKYKRINSNSMILIDLLHIILSKQKFIDETDLVAFSKIYLDGIYSSKYLLVQSLFKSKELLLSADKEKVFIIYRTIIDCSKDQIDYDKYLLIPEIIRSNSYMYYKYALDKVKTFEDFFYDMGSFYEYENKYRYDINYLFFDLLKMSSQFIDESVLKNDIDELTSNDNELLNKVGLGLININFKKCYDLFTNNLELFLNKEQYYSDLRCILENNDVEYDDVEKVINSIKNASFGINDSNTITMLKNHLLGLLKRRGADCTYAEEPEKVLEIVKNYNKRVYGVIYNPDDEEKEIQEKFRNKSLEEIAIEYKELRGGSQYFESILGSAVIKYLINHYPNDFYKHIGIFDAEFVIKLINYLVIEEGKDYKLLEVVLKESITLLKKDENYRCIIPHFISAIDLVSSKSDSDSIIKLASEVDYKWINLSDFNDSNNIIYQCVNDSVNSYIQLIIYLCSKNVVDTKYVREVIEYFINHYSCAKLKAILAFAFPKLLVIDEDYGQSLVEYIFDNEYNGTNVSYPMLAFDKLDAEKMIETLAKRDDFKNYITASFLDDNMAQSQRVLSIKVFNLYIRLGKHEEIIDLFFKKQSLSIVEWCMTTFNHWLSTNTIGEDAKKRFIIFLDKLCNYVAKTKNSFDADEMIKEVSHSILLFDNSDSLLWKLLILLFNHYKSFLSEKSVEIIEKYQNSEAKNIKKILNAYFSKYEKYQTYEETLLKVFNIVNNNDNYKECIKGWKVLLIKKNSELAKSLL